MKCLENLTSIDRDCGSETPTYGEDIPHAILPAGESQVTLDV